MGILEDRFGLLLSNCTLGLSCSESALLGLVCLPSTNSFFLCGNSFDRHLRKRYLCDEFSVCLGETVSIRWRNMDWASKHMTVHVCVCVVMRGVVCVPFSGNSDMVQSLVVSFTNSDGVN